MASEEVPFSDRESTEAVRRQRRRCSCVSGHCLADNTQPVGRQSDGPVALLSGHPTWGRRNNSNVYTIEPSAPVHYPVFSEYYLRIKHILDRTQTTTRRGLRESDSRYEGECGPARVFPDVNRRHPDAGVHHLACFGPRPGRATEQLLSPDGAHGSGPTSRRQRRAVAWTTVRLSGGQLRPTSPLTQGRPGVKRGKIRVPSYTITVLFSFIYYNRFYLP